MSGAAPEDVFDWMDAQSHPGIIWFAKRLAANDTLANDSHQAGPYLTKEVTFRIFPSINSTVLKNPREEFDLYIDSHLDHRKAKVIY